MLLLVAVAATSFAHAQPSIGVHANVIGASMTNKSDGEEANFDTRISWKAGLIAQVPVGTSVYFQPQLNLLSKGGKIDETETVDYNGIPLTATIKGDAKLTYLELPLNLVYSPGGEDGGFFIGIGPTIGYGIGGKIEGDATASIGGQTASQPFDADVKFDGKTDDELDQDDENAHFKALDFGANVLVGYQLPSGLFINAHYNYGFSNINPNSGAESKNRYFGIGIGYFFGRQ